MRGARRDPSISRPPSSPPLEAPARAPAPAGPEAREFEHEGRRWLAQPAGSGAAGTGVHALGLIEAVHFYDAADPHRPVREALLPRGRFDQLYDVELAALLGESRPIVIPRDR